MPQPTNRPAPTGTMGYPRVEQLIETEDFTKINRDFEKSYAELAAMGQRTRNLKKQKQIKGAMKAMELTMDLFRELLEVKYRLKEMAEEQQKRR